MKKRILAIILTVVALMAVMTVAVFAEGETTVVSSDDFKPVLDALTSQISVTTVVGIIAAVVTAGIGFVFLWWGIRKVFGATMKAFKGRGLSI